MIMESNFVLLNGKSTQNAKYRAVKFGVEIHNELRVLNITTSIYDKFIAGFVLNTIF